MLLWPALAGAATFYVTGTGDSTASCSAFQCPSLRSAVLASNTAGGTNTISVPAGNYTLTITPTGPDDGTTGDLHITANVTIVGAGAGAGGTTIIGDGDRIFDISANSVTLSGIAVTGGGSEVFGGAISETGASLTLTNDSFTADTTSSGGFGGAIWVNPAGSARLTITNSSFTSNVAAESGPGQGGFGGAISVQPGTTGTLNIVNSTFASNISQSGATSGGGFGGAIDFEPSTGGTLSVTGSTFSSNAAAGSSTQGGFGGGIFFNPAAGASALDITNSTFNGNSAGGHSGFGGAIFFQPATGSSGTLTQVTIVGNSATQSASAGGLDIEDAPMTIQNSIVSGNTVGSTPQNCSTSSGGSVVAAGHNIEVGTSCGFDIHASPNLAALANNGGPTQTMALLAGSPAIDAASPTFCPATDQRGVSRPDQPGTACDIGAYEFVTPKPAPPANTVKPAVSGTPLPGHVLACSAGAWSGTPSGFAFQWYRGSKAIPRATASTYTVQILDEAQALSCTVTASNAGGSASSTSQAVLVALPGTLNCPKPSGRLSGSRLGPLGLGFTRTHAEHLLRHRLAHTKSSDDFCLYAGWGIRVEYPSSKLLGRLSRRDRHRVADRIVLAVTSNPFYSFDGAGPGVTLAAVQRKLHLGKKIHMGTSDWYFVPEKHANLVLKVRNGVIYELGVADKRLSAGKQSELRLLQGFPSG